MVALVLAPFFSHLEFLFIVFNCTSIPFSSSSLLSQLQTWRLILLIVIDNPKLQASIKEGVQQDKARRSKQKGKKLQ
jgi:hypothetical protein